MVMTARVLVSSSARAIALIAAFVPSGAAGASGPEALQARWALRLPVVGTMRQVLAGSVRINTTPARYFVFMPGDGKRDIESRAKKLGWSAMPGMRRSFVSPAGNVEFTGYRSQGRILLVGAPVEDRGWVAMALFDGTPVWLDERGEAPGRDPAGCPRLLSSRRLLHVAGAGFEAACYTSPAAAGVLLAHARSQLQSAGWTVNAGAERHGRNARGLMAARGGGTEAVLYAMPEGNGCAFLLMVLDSAR
jgi:hypothetical protein